MLQTTELHTLKGWTWVTCEFYFNKAVIKKITRLFFFFAFLTATKSEWGFGHFTGYGKWLLSISIMGHFNLFFGWKVEGKNGESFRGWHSQSMCISISCLFNYLLSVSLIDTKFSSYRLLCLRELKNEIHSQWKSQGKSTKVCCIRKAKLSGCQRVQKRVDAEAH